MPINSRIHLRPLWLFGFVICVSLVGNGCIGPRIHHFQPVTHRIDHVKVLGDSLSISGQAPYYAFTNYGVKLVECRDDTGRELRLRSAQIFNSKSQCFELELDPPDPHAQSVALDVKFSTNAGVQRIKQTFELDRSGRSSYGNAAARFDRAEQVPHTDGRKHKDR